MNSPKIPEEIIMSKILVIRGKKVMLDRDIARFYGIETRVLNQAVRRNIERFPEHFMFQLTKQEMRLISQFVISKRERGGVQKPAFAFTEYGVVMLSSVLKNRRAIHINIQVIEGFVKLSHMIAENNSLASEIERINKKLVVHGDAIVKLIEQMNYNEKRPKPKIGFL